MPSGAGPKGASATAVNDVGVIVGLSYQGTSGNIEKGCIWYPDGSIVEIPAVPVTSSSIAWAVNNDGVVVGGTGVLAYILENGVMTTIQMPAPHSGSASGISDTGIVVGNYGGVAQGTARGFCWTAGNFEILPPFGSHPSSSARGVNDAGVVVGSSTSYEVPLGYRSTPTIWVGGLPQSLPLPPGYTSGGCSSINNAGTIVGFAQPGWSSGGGTINVIWIAGSVYKIDDLVVPGSPAIAGLRVVNDAGQLLTTGSAKVLTPVAPPFADVNGDCVVDGADISILLSEWGPSAWSPADIDDDGLVNGRDLALLLGTWGVTSAQ